MEPHLGEKIRQGFLVTVVAHIEADDSQVGAVRLQVMETLLVEVAALSRGDLSLRWTDFVQSVLQLPEGRQNVFAVRLTKETEGGSLTNKTSRSLNMSENITTPVTTSSEPINRMIN